MQTIKINIEQTQSGYGFCNGNISVARISNRTKGVFHLTVTNKPFGAVDSLAFAIEVVSDAICKRFDALGLDVEFNR